MGKTESQGPMFQGCFVDKHEHQGAVLWKEFEGVSLGCQSQMLWPWCLQNTVSVCLSASVRLQQQNRAHSLLHSLLQFTSGLTTPLFHFTGEAAANSCEPGLRPEGLMLKGSAPSNMGITNSSDSGRFSQAVGTGCVVVSRHINDGD